ncbi:hypothetical protein CXB51_004576 [Gossypium anomalum]|uniref:Starch synthase, chloroplastic/amyloplastic n=1 Tax=Gossypium anomalum TaxID=47600 RepID=A0A8J5ZME7_9ROSI|nr:hypothetical protein CXB51_004576 [Gossypium anomalum]
MKPSHRRFYFPGFPFPFALCSFRVLPVSRLLSCSSHLFIYSFTVSFKIPCFPMASIQLTRILWSCKLSTNIALSSRKCCSFRRTRQLDFGPLLKRNFQNRKLTAIRSEKSGNEGSISSAIEGEENSDVISSPEKPGLMLGIDRDDSGSVIGLNLIPGWGGMGPIKYNVVKLIIYADYITSKWPSVANCSLLTWIIGDNEAMDTEVVSTVTKVKDEEIKKKNRNPTAPYSKTGGLGDVCGSLPIELASRGHRVMVVSPRYLNGTSADEILHVSLMQIDASNYNVLEGNKRLHSSMSIGRVLIGWLVGEDSNHVFVDHPSYHRPGNPYGDSHGAFGDNQFRYTLLCHAACEGPLVLPLGGYTYGEKCLFLVNDWHAGLVSVLLAAKYRPFGVYKDARSILVIHNLAHQGVEPAATFKNLGLPSNWYGALEWVFPTWARTHALDTGEAVNILKGAIVTSDRILTVSKGYAWEITTVEGGYGLNELLSSRRSVLTGITNGIHIAEWDPYSDEHIAFHYSAASLSGKVVQCKTALQQELGFPIKPDCPLVRFYFVLEDLVVKKPNWIYWRLDYQKGIDLIHWAIPELMEDDVQFVMLGSGDPLYEDWMRSAENTYRDKFRGWVGFSVPISHRITAGCDILLMPSRFEPCGLNQLYAMRYGTVPVVHATGGLRDTVENFNPYAGEGRGEGTGWTFSPLTKDCMLNALKTAIRTYRDHKSTWEGLMRRCMQKDFTWENAAIQYEQVFEWAFIDPPYIM